MGTKTIGQSTGNAVLFPRCIYSLEIFEANFQSSKGDHYHLDELSTMARKDRTAEMARCQSGRNEKEEGRGTETERGRRTTEEVGRRTIATGRGGQIGCARGGRTQKDRATKNRRRTSAKK